MAHLPRSQDMRHNSHVTHLSWIGTSALGSLPER